MHAKAGSLFRCSCCGGEFPEEDAYVEEQLGPICQECKFFVFKAVVELKKHEIHRPINTNDINQSNHQRFKI